ncbi:hypothetical protein MSMAL_0878 [Methanosarcina mazei LYC]|uniref:DUF1638 domain-containing protein n=1 Tax=Methanosarcina mazei LYC TaxID=1434114 RepID=A0A0E3LVQ3_METMZ|nr:hypothetical protein MSMAL_0878 [Methanosarcina mazei LYC]
MPSMSIISCKIMQDEIIWILENDSSIDEIIIVDSKNIREFVEKLDKVNLLLVHMTPRPKFTIGGSYERYIYSKEWDDKGTNVSSSFN